MSRVFIIACVLSLHVSTSAMSAGPLENARIQREGKDLTEKLGRSSCGSEKRVDILLSPTLLSQYNKFRAFIIDDRSAKADKGAKKSECPKNLLNIETKKLAEFTENDKSISESFLLDANACQERGSQGTRILCVYPEHSGQDVAPVAQANFYFDTRVAKIEGVRILSVANGAIIFDVNTNAKKIIVCFGDSSNSIKGPKCPQGFDEKTLDGPTVKLENLVKHASYQVKIRLPDVDQEQDNWLNVGEATKTALTPLPVATPLELYDGQGGELMFSCDSSPKAFDCLIFYVFLFILALRFRPRIIHAKQAMLALSFLVLFLSFAQESHAEFGQISVGVLGSVYEPDLDSEKKGSGTIFPFYRSFFPNKKAQGSKLPLMGFDINWHLWDGLRLGFGVGYAYASGLGLILAQNGQPSKPAEAFNVSLHTYQIRPQISYELDHFMEYFPLFPCFRAGLIAQGFSFRPSKDDSNNAPKNNNGFRFGYFGSVGLKLRINFLEPSAVRSARSAGFFDNVYILSDLTYEKVDSFGKAGFVFSPKDIMGTTMPLLWTFGIAFDVI